MGPPAVSIDRLALSVRAGLLVETLGRLDQATKIVAAAPTTDAIEQFRNASELLVGVLAARGTAEWESLKRANPNRPAPVAGARGRLYVELAANLAANRISRLLRSEELRDAVGAPGQNEGEGLSWATLSASLRAADPIDYKSLAESMADEFEAAQRLRELTAEKRGKTGATGDTEGDSEKKTLRPWNADAHECLRLYKAGLKLDAATTIKSAIQDWAAGKKAGEKRSVDGMIRRFNDHPGKWKHLKDDTKTTRRKVSS